MDYIDDPNFREVVHELLGLLDSPTIAFTQELQVFAFNKQSQYLSPLLDSLQNQNLLTAFPWLQSYQSIIESSIQEKKHVTVDSIPWPGTNGSLKECSLSISPLATTSYSIYVVKLNSLLPPEITMKMRGMDRLSSLGLLTAGLLHELKNIINFIVNSTQPIQRNLHDLVKLLGALEENKELGPEENLKKFYLLKKEMEIDASVEELKDLVDSIQMGSERMSSIIKSAKFFTQGKEDTCLEIQVEENLDATLNLLHHQIKRGVTIHKDYGTTLKMLCDPGKINQVFLNILINAIDSLSDKKGDLWIKTAMGDSNNDIIISIKDSGCGMDENIMAHIFETFFTTKSAENGSGMGLAISNGIVSEYGGTISVSSQPGKGSEFVIKLPIQMKKSTQTK